MVSMSWIQLIEFYMRERDSGEWALECIVSFSQVAMVESSNAGIESWLWLLLSESLSLSEPDPISVLGI